MTTLILKSRREIAEHTTEFTFEIPESERAAFTWKAGQAIDITYEKMPYSDEGGKTRTFSIASSPNHKGEITIATRNSESAWKRSLLEAPLRTTLSGSNPTGQFILPRTSHEPLVFVAGGIGITPFHSLVTYATEEKRSDAITLIYSNRNEGSAAYLSDLRTLVTKNPRFNLIENYGPLTAELITQKITDIPGSVFYVAGPPGMVGMVHTELTKAGAKEECILIEEFAGYH